MHMHEVWSMDTGGKSHAPGAMGWRYDCTNTTCCGRLAASRVTADNGTGLFEVTCRDCLRLTEITVCFDCAYELKYAESSARDFHGVTPEESARRDAVIDSMGVVTPVRETTDPIMCRICEESTLHATRPSHVFKPAI
jgi:hypothetical protein